MLRLAGRMPTVSAGLLAILVLVSGCTPGLSPTSRTAGSLEDALNYTPERALRLQELRDQKVAACMRERGFEWYPTRSDPHLRSSPHGVYELETPDAVRDYRLEYGYGIAEQVFVLQDAGRQFRQREPQAQYLAQLDPQLLAEYETALHGDPSVREPGCMEQAIGDTGGPAALGDDTEIVHAYGDAISEYLDDSRVEEIDAQVLDCMREHGFDYESLEAIEIDFQLQLQDLVGGEARFDDRGRLHFSFGPKRGETLRIPRSDLERLRTEELETAEREVRCRDEYRKELGEILAGYAAPVIEEFRSEIDRAASAYESAAGGDR